MQQIALREAEACHGANGPLPNDLDVRDLRLSCCGREGDGGTVLDIPEFTIESGDAVAVTGPSGAGKTSLLNILGGLERPNAGSVRWGTADLAAKSEADRDRWRRRNVGYVFQDFRLFPGMSVLDNVMLATTFDRIMPPAALRVRAAMLLERVGLPQRRQRVETLSRGEMQRVAVARALLCAPLIVLADDPTADLDAASAVAVADLLLDLAREADATLIVATRDRVLLARFADIRHLANGRFA